MDEAKVKLSRRVEQWTNCNPDKMATCQSQQATIFAMRDAKHDLLACFRRIDQLEAEIETLRTAREPVLND